mmetsp:Transcript_15379/g.61872  ORF Transcript_15379/g.61872 Transcript_15379/m.61872 type:complete len:178 (-) Transcript_15379:1129-1662(-)
MTDAEARRLLEDEAALVEFFQTEISAVKSMRELRDSLRASNLEAAKTLTKDVAALEAARQAAFSARTDAADALDAHDATLRRARAVAPDDVRALDDAAAKAERDRAERRDRTSEALCDDFKDGKLDLDAWKAEYRAARREYHTHAGLVYAHRAAAAKKKKKSSSKHRTGGSPVPTGS